MSNRIYRVQTVRTTVPSNLQLFAAPKHPLPNCGGKSPADNLSGSRPVRARIGKMHTKVEQRRSRAYDMTRKLGYVGCSTARARSFMSCGEIVLLHRGRSKIRGILEPYMVTQTR